MRSRKHSSPRSKEARVSLADLRRKAGWSVFLKTRLPIITAKPAARLRLRTWTFTRTKKVAVLSRTAHGRTVGFTNSVPQEWPSPGASLDSEVFWQTFRDCSNKLPKNVGTVFTLREIDGIESREICAMLNVSESNLWVMLHRARMALRRCLETNWFGKKDRLG